MNLLPHLDIITVVYNSFYIAVPIHTSIVTTILTSFTMEYRGRSRADISRFYREIYGYISHSYYSKLDLQEGGLP
ncbi:MAG: hypothetical protein QW478_13875 [Candidatus Micrarchaeaceae archaeon]